MKIGIFTCVYGDYDLIPSLPKIYIDPNNTYNFLLFTDKNHENNRNWQIIIHEPFLSSPMKDILNSETNKNFWNVILLRYDLTYTPQLRDYDLLFYIDASLCIINPNLIINIEKYTQEHNMKTGIILSNNLINCLYHEIYMMPSNGKYCNFNIPQFITDLVNKKIPYYYGSFFTGFIAYYKPYSDILISFYKNLINLAFNMKYCINPEKLFLCNMQVIITLAIYKYRVPYVILSRIIGIDIEAFTHKVDLNVNRIYEIPTYSCINKSVGHDMIKYVKQCKYIYINSQEFNLIIYDIMTGLLHNNSHRKTIILNSDSSLAKIPPYYGIQVENINNFNTGKLDMIIVFHPEIDIFYTVKKYVLIIHNDNENISIDNYNLVYKKPKMTILAKV